MKSASIVIIVIIIGIVGAVMYSGEKKSGNDTFLMMTPEATSTPVQQGIAVGEPTPGVPSGSQSTTTNKMNNIVTIETNKGTIVIELYPKDAPKAAENMVTLAAKGFYDGVIFHRVISGFMIQGGDPTGTGRGGPGYTFADELDATTPSYQKGYVRGAVAMANAGPNTNGSQFFIMHKDYPLPHNYTIFGQVTKGMEVVDAIAASKVNAEDRPLEDVVMKKVTVSAK